MPGKRPIHIVFLIANNSSVPYFNWFAARAEHYEDIRFSFVALHRERPLMLDEMKARNCDCYWIPFDPAKRKSHMLKIVFSITKLLRKIKPDIVHSHLFDDSLPSLIAARLAGVPLRVVTKQDTTFHWYYAPKGVMFDRLNNRNATHIVAVSNECKDFILEKEKADPSKVHVIHNGVPLDYCTSQREEAKARLTKQFGLEGKIVIGTVARLIEWKGYRQLIEAAGLIVKKYPNSLFLWAGEGEQKPELERLIKEKGLEKHVVFTGWVDRADIPSLYGVMDIYLHAARFEPFGFVIAEAMMNSVPVVSTDTGAAHDAIVHKKSGYLTPYDDPAALAEGVFYMLENDRKTIGEAGRRTAMDLYNFDRMWEGYTNLYKTMFTQGIRKQSK